MTRHRADNLDLADWWLAEPGTPATFAWPLLRWLAPRAAAGVALVMVLGWLPFALFGAR
jgi:hypothetical protein